MSWQLSWSNNFEITLHREISSVVNCEKSAINDTFNSVGALKEYQGAYENVMKFFNET
jgi:hypothetical protein